MECNSTAQTESEDSGIGGRELTELCAGLLNDDEFISRYVIGNAKVERAVIDNYLRSKVRGAPVMTSGAAALAPLPRPKTLEEAKQLCERFLHKS